MSKEKKKGFLERWHETRARKKTIEAEAKIEADKAYWEEFEKTKKRHAVEKAREKARKRPLSTQVKEYSKKRLKNFGKNIIEPKRSSRGSHKKPIPIDDFSDIFGLGKPKKKKKKKPFNLDEIGLDL